MSPGAWFWCSPAPPPSEYGLRRAVRAADPQPGRPGAQRWPMRNTRKHRCRTSRLKTRSPAPRQVKSRRRLPRRSHPSAWTLLKRVPLVLARLVLELVPVLGIVVVGHLIAGSSLGGQTVSRLIILAVVDAYAICIALLCVARMLLSPEEAPAAAVSSADAPPPT